MRCFDPASTTRASIQNASPVNEANPTGSFPATRALTRTLSGQNCSQAWQTITIIAGSFVLALEQRRLKNIVNNRELLSLVDRWTLKVFLS